MERAKAAMIGKPDKTKPIVLEQIETSTARLEDSVNKLATTVDALKVERKNNRNGFKEMLDGVITALEKEKAR